MGRVTDTDKFLLLLHITAAFWYVIGLAVVQLSYIRGLQDDQGQAEAFNEASHYQGVLLVPGAIAVGFTGVFLWANVGYNLLTTGWLLALEVLVRRTDFEDNKEPVSIKVGESTLKVPPLPGACQVLDLP